MFIFKRLERKLDNVVRLLTKKESGDERLGTELKKLRDEQSVLEAHIAAVEEMLRELLSKKGVSEDEEPEKKDVPDPKDIVDTWRNGEGADKWTGIL